MAKRVPVLVAQKFRSLFLFVVRFWLLTLYLRGGIGSVHLYFVLFDCLKWHGEVVMEVADTVN